MSIPWTAGRRAMTTSDHCYESAGPVRRDCRLLCGKARALRRKLYLVSWLPRGSPTLHAAFADRQHLWRQGRIARARFRLVRPERAHSLPLRGSGQADPISRSEWIPDRQNEATQACLCLASRTEHRRRIPHTHTHTHHHTHHEDIWVPFCAFVFNLIFTARGDGQSGRGQVKGSGCRVQVGDGSRGWH